MDAVSLRADAIISRNVSFQQSIFHDPAYNFDHKTVT